MRNFLRATCLFLGVGAGHLLPSASGLSQDWPQWRGPNRDGVVHGVKVPATWPKTLKEEWKVTVGEGVASPVVVGGNVYVFTRQKAGEEVVLCFDLASGKEVWKSSYPAPYKLGGPAHGYEGPRSTPAVADGRVFTFGISGILSCLDAKRGSLLWRKDFVKQYPRGTAPGWGTSASPLVDCSLCIIHVGGPDVGGLTAFDTHTGDVKWCYDGDGPAYGSPILVDLAGERQVVTLTLNHFLGVSAVTGARLWTLPCREIHSENCLTPVLYKDLLIFAGRNEPLRAIRLQKGNKGFTPLDVWKGDGPTLYMSSPVREGNLLFGASSRGRGCFFCLDANSGKTRWESDEKQGVGFTSILNLGSVLLFLTQNGRLIVVQPNGAEYQPVAEYKVSDRRIMAHPVFLGDRILLRDELTLRSLRIEADGK